MLNTITFPKISIVMPTYNRAELIMETIDSIRNQTWQNWELIIVDDGSDDNTEERIAGVKDERVHFYKAGRIGIGGKIKNIGLQKARGELIAFMDSDDCWAEKKLEKQVAALQQYPESGFSLTNGYNFRTINEPLEFFYKQVEGMRCDYIFFSFFMSEVVFTAPSLIFRKECLDEIGLFDETKPFSDVEFILRLSKHFKAVILYEVLLYRRLHNANDSSMNWEEGYFQGLSLINYYKNILPPDIAGKAIFKLYVNFGEGYLLHKKTGKAIRKFFKAWKNKPLSIIPLKKIAKAILYLFKK